MLRSNHMHILFIIFLVFIKKNDGLESIMSMSVPRTARQAPQTDPACVDGKVFNPEADPSQPITVTQNGAITVYKSKYKKDRIPCCEGSGSICKCSISDNPPCKPIPPITDCHKYDDFTECIANKNCSWAIAKPCLSEVFSIKEPGGCISKTIAISLDCPIFPLPPKGDDPCIIPESTSVHCNNTLINVPTTTYTPPGTGPGKPPGSGPDPDDPKNPKDPKDPNKDPKDPNKDPKDPNKDPKDPNKDPKDPNKDPKDPNKDPKDPNKDPKDPKDPPKDPNEPKEPTIWTGKFELETEGNPEPSTRPKLDIYFLCDASRSTLSIKASINNKMKSVKEKFSDPKFELHFGLGTFIDKGYRFAPREKRQSSSGTVIKMHSFINHVSLTPSAEEFGKKVQDIFDPANSIIKPDYNWFRQESQMDALAQIGLCDEINWRENARRVIVMFTDSGYHTPLGETMGEESEDGLVRFDGRCSLDSTGFYTNQNLMNYPTEDQVRDILREKQISLIIALYRPSTSSVQKFRNFEKDYKQYQEFVEHTHHSTTLSIWEWDETENSNELISGEITKILTDEQKNALLLKDKTVQLYIEPKGFLKGEVEAYKIFCYQDDVDNPEKKQIDVQSKVCTLKNPSYRKVTFEVYLRGRCDFGSSDSGKKAGAIEIGLQLRKSSSTTPFILLCDPKYNIGYSVDIRKKKKDNKKEKQEDDDKDDKKVDKKVGKDKKDNKKTERKDKPPKGRSIVTYLKEMSTKRPKKNIKRTTKKPEEKKDDSKKDKKVEKTKTEKPKKKSKKKNNKEN